MLTEKQLNIFEVFAKKPFEELTRTQIKKTTKEKSNNALALAIKNFLKERLVVEKKVGRTGLFTLNLENNSSMQYLALVNQKRIPPTITRSISELKREINTVTHFYAIVIFGSYASNEQKISSDIDIAILIENMDQQKKVEAAVNNAKLKIVAKVDVYVISAREFIEMLISEEENLGKQIARKHRAVFNHQIFYGLINEGMKRGFRT